MAQTDGPVFTHLQDQLGLTNSKIEGDLLTLCCETVDELLALQAQGNQPGMLLGKIQSGKTKTFIGVLALAFDNGYDHAVVFTKGTKALTQQTVSRLSREFSKAIDLEEVRVYDIMALPQLTDWALQRKLIIVCKKEDDNLNILTDVLTQQYPDLVNRRFLLIDDEADLASVGYNRTENGINANVIPTQLNDLRASLIAASFLQVTATPYALFLQPDGSIIIPATQQAFEPIRPAFKKLIQPHGAYIGGEYYFEQSKNPGSVASFLHAMVSPNELVVLRQQNSPDLDLLQVLTSPSIASLRRAIVTFIVGGTLRRWQQHEAGQPHKRYSFLVHIEVSKAAHNWQEEIVRAIVNRLRQDANAGMAVATPLVQAAYDDLTQSITAAVTQLPTFADVLAQFPAALGGIVIQTVNAATRDHRVGYLAKRGGACYTTALPWPRQIPRRLARRGVAPHHQTPDRRGG